MTNYEANKETIVSIITNNCGIYKNDNKPVICNNMKCYDCKFHGDCCGEKGREKMRQWLESEYEEPKVDWSKVAPDTPILVRNSEEIDMWTHRYFAYYKNNTVYAYAGGSTSWSSGGATTGWKDAKLAGDDISLS